MDEYINNEIIKKHPQMNSNNKANFLWGIMRERLFGNKEFPTININSSSDVNQDKESDFNKLKKISGTDFSSRYYEISNQSSNSNHSNHLNKSNISNEIKSYDINFINKSSNDKNIKEDFISNTFELNSKQLKIDKNQEKIPNNIQCNYHQSSNNIQCDEHNLNSMSNNHIQDSRLQVIVHHEKEFESVSRIKNNSDFKLNTKIEETQQPLSKGKKFLSHRDITSYHLCKKSFISKYDVYNTFSYVFNLSLEPNKKISRDNQTNLTITKSSEINQVKTLLREKSKIQLSDLINENEIVDNTGNTGIWFSEECLGFLIMKSISLLDYCLLEYDLDFQKREVDFSEISIPKTISTMEHFEQFSKEEISVEPKNILPIFHSLKENLKYLFTNKDNTCRFLELGCGNALSGFSIYQYIHSLIKHEKQFISNQDPDSSNLSDLTNRTLNNFISQGNKIEIILSDGNKQACDNAKWNYDHICSLKHPSNEYIQLRIAYIPWQKPETYSIFEKQIDFIFISDCLFFHNFHDDLLNLLEKCLKNNGLVWILSPIRSPTMNLFIKNAISRNIWNIEVYSNYNLEINQGAMKLKAQFGDLFQKDIHFPLLIEMKLK